MLISKDNKNKAFELLEDSVSRHFSRESLFFSRDHHLCFVCGCGSDTLPDSKTRSLRSIFIEHVEQLNPNNIICIRAESAVTELSRQLEERGANISEIEKIIAVTANSILIFPESPGSFAELGYFSADPSICKRILVAVRQEYQSGSFLMLGPIHLINKHSIFAPLPIVLGNNPEDHMKTISDRLIGESKNKRAYKDRFQLNEWKSYSDHATFCLLDELIYLAGAITEPDLFYFINKIFGAFDSSKIRLQLGLLTATMRIYRNEYGDIFALKRNLDLIGANKPETRSAIKARWRAYYQGFDPETITEHEKLLHG